MHEHWLSEVIALGSVLGADSVRFYSFELKRSLNYGNLRESFFQTVSNSSWAHFSYLVAADLNSDPQFRDDLGRLANSFGIGVIRLNPGDPEDSEVVFAAQMRKILDFETMNMLAEKNSDFRTLLKGLDEYIGSQGDIRLRPSFDAVPDRTELVQSKSDRSGVTTTGLPGS